MRFLSLFLLLQTALSPAQQKRKPEKYPVHPDSVRQDGVPVGKVTAHRFTKSRVFPGTERDYWVYVPAQYDGTKPACLMIFQDGHRFADEKRAPSKMPIVLDNLIHKKEMPVTIGVFVNPGVVPAGNENAQPRFNRSYEYDGFFGELATFYLDELLPEIGKEYRISDDPNDRGLCGASSGAIAAFNVAWHRPDSFRRVYSIVGTFVGLRGGNEYPILVRKTEPKPLRIYLQDGSNDLDIYGGNWFISNQDMLSAFQFSGYEVDHLWGEGYHGQTHGAAIMPDVMKWLWKDWPTKVTTHYDQSKSRAPEMLHEEEKWELISEGHGFTEGPAVSASGDLYFSDLRDGRIYRITTKGEKSVFWDGAEWGKGESISADRKPPWVNGLAFAPEGKRLIACLPKAGRVVAFDTEKPSQKPETLVTGHISNDVVVAHDGTIYFTEPGKKRVTMIRPGGKEAVVAGEGFSGVNGVVLSPDQTLLYAADYGGRYVWSASRKADGTLTHLQPYFHLHLPPASVDTRSQADGMAVDQDGWLLVATAMGVQICDPPGRVNLILPPPPGTRHPSNLTFGIDGHTLYATCGDQVFSRKVKLTGALPWKAPVKPPKPRL